MIVAATASGTGATEHRPRAPWRARRGWLLVGVAALAGLLLTGLPDDSGPTLVLRDVDTGTELHRRAVAVGEHFELRHTHSVTRRPVLETFGVDDAPSLTLEGMVFDHPGPNLPTGPERFGDRMTSFTSVDGVYRVDHHGYPIGRVTIRVGTAQVDHTLAFSDGTTLRFLDLTRAGGGIELEVEPGSTESIRD